LNRDLMKDFLRESFPNPERKGCPDEDTLQALAEDRLPLDHPALLHVGSCSECYAEYLHMRQDFEEALAGNLSPEKNVGPVAVPAEKPPMSVPHKIVPAKAASRIRLRLLAAAAALIVLVGGEALYLAHSRQNPSHSGTLAESETPVTMSVDLFSAVTTRGLGDEATPIQRVSLPAAIVQLTVTLPRFSQTGNYEIQVSKDRAGHQLVANGFGTAAEIGGKVLLPVTLDLRPATPGAYFLATVRGSDDGTYYYPLQVR
jgi:hypothetical protein